VLLGNVREISLVAGRAFKSTKVDPVGNRKKMVDLAQGVSKERNMTVVLRGSETIIVKNNEQFIVKNRADMSKWVVGVNCMITAAVGAFVAVEKDLALAAAAAVVCCGVTAEIAAESSKGPASFKTNFIDQLYNLTAEDVKKRQRVE